MTDRSAVGMSGLVGGDDELVRGLSEEEEESDLLDPVGEVSDRGYKSGALYASILVVWVRAIGPDILLRIAAELFLAVVLLRCGNIPRSCEDCFRLVVKARARDILADCFKSLLVMKKN